MSNASPQAAINTAIASGTAGVQGVTAAAGLRLIGFSVAENAGAPAAATVLLRHGTDATGAPIAYVKLAASGSFTQFLGDGGVYAPNGIYVDRQAGTTEISLWTRTGE